MSLVFLTVSTTEIFEGNTGRQSSRACSCHWFECPDEGKAASSAFCWRTLLFKPILHLIPGRERVGTHRQSWYNRPILTSSLQRGSLTLVFVLTEVWKLGFSSIVVWAEDLCGFSYSSENTLTIHVRMFSPPAIERLVQSIFMHPSLAAATCRQNGCQSP